MNREELLSAIASNLKDKGDKKKLRVRKSTFHITDDDGNSTNFVINTPATRVIYTRDDVRSIIDSFVDVVNDCIARGEPVNLFGVGTFYTKHMGARRSKDVYTAQYYDIPERYVPGFRPSGALRTSAKQYDLNLKERCKDYDLPEPVYEEELEVEDADA